MWHAYIGAGAVLLYPVGVPVFFFVLLNLNHDSLFKDEDLMEKRDIIEAKLIEMHEEYHAKKAALGLHEHREQQLRKDPSTSEPPAKPLVGMQGDTGAVHVEVEMSDVDSVGKPAAVPVPVLSMGDYGISMAGDTPIVPGLVPTAPHTAPMHGGGTLQMSDFDRKVDAFIANPVQEIGDKQRQAVAEIQGRYKQPAQAWVSVSPPETMPDYNFGAHPVTAGVVPPQEAVAQQAGVLGTLQDPAGGAPAAAAAAEAPDVKSRLEKLRDRVAKAASKLPGSARKKKPRGKA